MWDGFLEDNEEMNPQDLEGSFVFGEENIKKDSSRKKPTLRSNR